MKAESLHGNNIDLEEITLLTKILRDVSPKKDISSNERRFLTNHAFKDDDPKNIVGLGFGNVTCTNMWERRETREDVPLINWQKNYKVKGTKTSFDLKKFFPRKHYLEDIPLFQSSLEEAIKNKDDRLQRVKDTFNQDIRRKKFNHVYKIKEDSLEIYVFATSDENLPETIENKMQKQRESAYQAYIQKELF